jgi:hypothetical protein
MSITRRTGLAAIIGGIFGAKPAVEQAVKQFTDGDLSPPSAPSAMSYADKLVETKQIDSVFNRTEHIRQLTEQAAGKLLPYQQEEIERYNKVTEHKVRLKSISKNYKNIMEAEEAKKRAINAWKKEAKQQLLRHFGIAI